MDDPSADNIAYNAGALAGSAIIGGLAGRPLACKLSPPGNQPAAGWQAWKWRADTAMRWRAGGPSGKPSFPSMYKDFGPAMATGPSPLSAAGTTAAIGLHSANVRKIAK